MANKNKQQAADEQQRQTRKEVLVARKQREQTRNIYLAAGLVLGLLVVVFLIAIINELFISPNRAVAEVNGEEISLSDWQERVAFERAQRIILLNNQLAQVNDVGLVQQFSGQTINELMQPDIMGLTILNQMTEDEAVMRAAEERGITVTDEEVDVAIGESFSYFGGESPTPFPEPTQTVMPTPSITPIPTAVITELLPTQTPFPPPTVGPTSTPLPTATAVSKEAFDEEFSNYLAGFSDLGVNAEMFREAVRIQLYRDKLADDLAEELTLTQQADHASFYYLGFDNEEEANAAFTRIQDEGYLPLWNEIRSRPFDPEAPSTSIASEVLWRNQVDLEQGFDAEFAAEVFSLQLNRPSDIFVQPVDEENNGYFIIMVSGREMRDLTEAAFQQAKQQNLSSFIGQQLTENTVTFPEYFEGRAPDRPRLDPVFLTPPTETPAAPLPDLPAPDDPSSDGQ
ncbi:MAG: hypothetical protein GY796_17890 [Chloroflexi bacterium]|nr:hypothetical protein [Chloroflexota bacterium]